MPICNIRLQAVKPPKPGYPTELNTIGDHIRKVRMDRGMLQIEVAKQVGVDVMTIGHWENNLCTPMIGKMKGIIRFLGYIPKTHPYLSKWTETLVAYRQTNGLTRKDMAKVIGIDERTLRDLEEGKVRFFRTTEEKIKRFFQSISSM